MSSVEPLLLGLKWIFFFNTRPAANKLQVINFQRLPKPVNNPFSNDYRGTKFHQIKQSAFDQK